MVKLDNLFTTLSYIERIHPLFPLTPVLYYASCFLVRGKFN